jgi:hypothetical protein
MGYLLSGELFEIYPPAQTGRSQDVAFFLTPPQLCFCQTHESLSFLGLWYVFEHFRTAISAVLPLPPFLFDDFVTWHRDQIVVRVNPRVGQHFRHFFGVHIANNQMPSNV